MNGPIDIIIPWVDGSDPEWLKEKQKYMDDECTDKAANSNIRYQNWENLQYLFRAIEKFMPWVNKIFFVTWGHIPNFLNTNHPKLKIVNHADYIPQKYLPTFNSNTIELNYHRIKELSDNFILFNDDTFPIKPIKQTYYFKNNTVCEEAIEGIIPTVCRHPGLHMHHIHILNNLTVINRNFKKRDVQKKYFWKWFYPGYGSMLKRNISLCYWYDFSGFRNAHMPVAIKKSVLEHLWEIEYEAMNKSSLNKFRNVTDLTQYLIRYWQICSGDFLPRRTLGKYYYLNNSNYKQVAKDIVCQKYQMICLNEDCTSEEFVQIKKEINSAFEKILPDKSSFEK